MGHQSYVLLCSKITSFPPSEGEFSEKLGIFSKVKKNLNPTCYKLEKINENYDNKNYGYHDAFKIYGASKLCTVICSKMTSFPPFRGGQQNHLWLHLF
jgi:hypothetical protein